MAALVGAHVLLVTGSQSMAKWRRDTVSWRSRGVSSLSGLRPTIVGSNPSGITSETSGGSTTRR